MGEQIKNSSFQQHLMGGSVELLESKLGIKAREGFPQSWEMKEKFPWDSDEDFNEFVSYCGIISFILWYVRQMEIRILYLSLLISLVLI